MMMSKALWKETVTKIYSPSLSFAFASIPFHWESILLLDTPPFQIYDQPRCRIIMDILGSVERVEMTEIQFSRETNRTKIDQSSSAIEEVRNLIDLFSFSNSF